MDVNTFHSLIDKYVEGTATQEERTFLDDYASELAEIGRLTRSEDEKKKLKERLYQNILKGQLPTRGKVVPFYRTRLSKVIAAAVIVFMIVGAYLIVDRKTDVKPTAQKESVKDVAPGHEGAILTLADGSKIILDSRENGVITRQGNSDVVKQKNALSYQTNSVGQSVVYNTMTTPKGRQYSLVLSDGSRVWLNANSSITFPTVFTGRERKVQMTGEAYFEVAHNASAPFRVAVNDMTVEVLGTHFNINSYADEDQVKTTLLEGKVRVTKQQDVVELRPGQQAVINQALNRPISVVSDPDLDGVMAWKNGLFHFNSASLQEVMRQIIRWYDVDVVYEGKIPDRAFDGEISRQSNLSQVLKILEEAKIHFTIEDRKLIVKP